MSCCALIFSFALWQIKYGILWILLQLYMISWTLSSSSFWNTSLQEHKNIKKINSLHSEQIIIVINVAPLFAVFRQGAITINIKMDLPEKEETSLVFIWLPQNYFRFACIMYATCTVYIMYTTLKFYLFSAPGCEEIKHTSATLSLGCSSALAFLMLGRVPEWVTTSQFEWVGQKHRYNLPCSAPDFY